MIRCIDGKEFDTAAIVGSVTQRNSDDVHIPAVIGEYPVIVVFWDRVVTYVSQIKRIL